MAERNQYFEAYSGVTLQLSDAVLDNLQLKLADNTAVYRAVASMNEATLTGILNVKRRLPDRISGRLLAPGARPGARLRLSVPRPVGHQGLWVPPSGVTDSGGAFDLDLPSGDLPGNGITLLITGAQNESLSIPISRGALIGDGALGVLAMTRALPPVPMSVVGTLASYAPSVPDDVDTQPDAWAELQPGITLGEGDCASRIDPMGRAFDTYSYGLLFRLVDPELWPKILSIQLGDQDLRLSMRQLNALPPPLRNLVLANGEIRFDEREPITQPISVDGFASAISDRPRDYPKAGTLGIGYVLGMRQNWEPTGFSLGDLIYSLPLAPGEVQRLAVRERRETLATFDRESLSVREQRAFDEAVSSSTNSIFSSALDESGSGSTTWNSRSNGGNAGGGFSLLGFSLGGGGGWSNASGSTTGTSSASRNFVSSSVEQFNATVARQSATARQAARTSMRLASSRDSEEVTTRVIANNNRLHALTVQYWEVLRHYSVSSRPDDVTLVAFVPLQLVQWRPIRVPLKLDYDAETPPSRQSLRRRYAMIWRYADRIWRRLPRRNYVKGMRQLRRLMTTPDIGVSVQSGIQQVSLNIRITGSFLPFDSVTVDAVDDRGRRIGRASLSASGAPPDFGAAIDQDALLGKLRDHRADRMFSFTQTGTMFLRPGIDLSRVERFDIRTRMVPYAHAPDPEQVKLDLGFLNLQSNITIEDPANIGGSEFAKLLTVRPFTVSAGTLRREVGGARISALSIADSNDENSNLVAASKVVASVLPPWLPLPAASTSPVLTDEQLVEIERLFQHVVSNPVRYSQAVWSGLDADERAIMLEKYTIGVPPASDAIEDASQEIPLLNCVTNRLMGFFGNSMILPFHLPPELERARSAGTSVENGVTTRDIQEALLQFHREGFKPSKLSVTIPSNGQLGEAVLGQCASGEKIDLTRFWNWADGAEDTPRDVSLPTQPGTELAAETGATTPRVAAGLLNPAIGEGFVPDAPQQPTANLEAALKAAVPWLQTKIEDVRGMDALTALMGAALGSGEKPGVDVAAVKALNEATKTEGLKGFKAADLKTLFDAETANLQAQAADIKETREKAEAKPAGEKAAKIKALVDDAPNFAALLEATPEAERAGSATAIVTEILGDDLNTLTAGEKADLFAAYAPKTGDAAQDEDGKAAMRTALSLP